MILFENQYTREEKELSLELTITVSWARELIRRFSELKKKYREGKLSSGNV